MELERSFELHRPAASNLEPNDFGMMRLCEGELRFHQPGTCYALSEAVSHQVDETMNHEHGKSKEMKPLQRLRQALVVARQAAETRRSAETALDNPAMRQEGKALFGLRQLDHFKGQSAVRSLLLRLLADR